jgi:hypothetical protein
MRDLDLTQYTEADQCEVNPPIEVEAATWAAAGQLIGGSESARNGSDAYAGQTVVKGGSRLLILA